MKILCDAGIVVGRKDGKWMHYSISKNGLEQVMRYLKVLIKNAKLEEKSDESFR